MGTDTTARQNTIIWSATGTLILVLLGIIGWLVIEKDRAVLNSISDLKVEIHKAIDEGSQRDTKILEAITKLCDRVGGVESRVSNLEIFIQMPFNQRHELFNSSKK